jgi:hypothetical protein
LRRRGLRLGRGGRRLPDRLGLLRQLHHADLHGLGRLALAEIQLARRRHHPDQAGDDTQVQGQRQRRGLPPAAGTRGDLVRLAIRGRGKGVQHLFGGGHFLVTAGSAAIHQAQTAFLAALGIDARPRQPSSPGAEDDR